MCVLMFQVLVVDTVLATRHVTPSAGVGFVTDADNLAIAERGSSCCKLEVILHTGKVLKKEIIQ